MWRLKNIVFEFNPYNPCVTNKIKVANQHKVRFHVDDVMCSHVNPRVYDKFKEWANHYYGKHGEVKANKGKLYKFLIITFYFTEKGEVKIKMYNYVERINNDLPMKISKSDTDSTPDRNNLFEKGNIKRMGKKESEEFHTSVARGIFLAKRAIPDIHQTFAVLSTRVKGPNKTN